jgi:hypothetical protein
MVKAEPAVQQDYSAGWHWTVSLANSVLMDPFDSEDTSSSLAFRSVAADLFVCSFHILQPSPCSAHSSSAMDVLLQKISAAGRHPILDAFLLRIPLYWDQNHPVPSSTMAVLIDCSPVRHCIRADDAESLELQIPARVGSGLVLELVPAVVALNLVENLGVAEMEASAAIQVGLVPSSDSHQTLGLVRGHSTAGFPDFHHPHHRCHSTDYRAAGVDNPLDHHRIDRSRPILLRNGADLGRRWS